jgi:hypothetical protein
LHETDPVEVPELSDSEIRRLVGEIAAGSPSAEAAWQQLRGLGAAVAPFLLDAYPTARRWQGRTALVFHAIRFARVSEAAYALGYRALGDKSYMVRYRACMVLAYALRADAIPALEALLQHTDPRTQEDAARALDAIHHQNHHYFVDRQHSGRSFWVVNDSDEPSRGQSPALER